MVFSPSKRPRNVRPASGILLLVWLFASIAPLPAAAAGQRVSIVDVRHWSLGDVTRVAIEATGDFEYKTGRLSNPERVYFDIQQSVQRLSKGPTHDIPVNDGLVKTVRVGQYRSNVTRVVLDLEGKFIVSASQLANPDRLMVEIRAPSPPGQSTSGKLPAVSPVTASRRPGEPSAPAKQEPPPATAAPAKQPGAEVAMARPEKPISKPAEGVRKPAPEPEKPAPKPAEVAAPPPGPAETVTEVGSSAIEVAEVRTPATGPAPEPEEPAAEPPTPRPAEAVPGTTELTQPPAAAEPPATESLGWPPAAPKPEPREQRPQIALVEKAPRIPAPVAERVPVAEPPKPPPAESAPAEAEPPAQASKPETEPEKESPPEQPAATVASSAKEAPAPETTETAVARAEPPAAEPEAPEAIETAGGEPVAVATPAKQNTGGDHSLTRALGLKLGRIVIDPGHGGRDTGTIGPSGIQEKQITLDIAKKLAKLIQERMGSEVVLTRTSDVSLPLEARTELANKKRADLFLSIHVNSSRYRSVNGVETFYLNFTRSRADLEVAARENAGSHMSIHELSNLVQKIALDDKVQESRELAASIQSSVHALAKKHIPGVRDRGVKKAPFVVLIGAQMPSILVELGFISNPQEEQLLRNANHRTKIAEAIFEGLFKYAGSLSHFDVAQTTGRDGDED